MPQIANIADLLNGADRFATRQDRAAAALTIQREMTAAVARMWALYELHGEIGDEQPLAAAGAYAASLDEWWHACKAAESAWEAAAAKPRDAFTFEAQGDETVIFRADDDSCAPVAVVAYPDGQPIEAHWAMVGAIVEALNAAARRGGA